MRCFSLIAVAGFFLASCGHAAGQSAEESDNHLVLFRGQNQMSPISDTDLKSMVRSNNIILCAQLYNRAKDAFYGSQWDRILDLTEGLATAPTSHTDHTHLRVRSQTLRTVIYAGQLKAKLALAEAYGKGAGKAADAPVKAEDRRLENSYLAAAAQAALGLAETADLLVLDESIHQTIPLEASIPPTEDHVEIGAIARIQEGSSLTPDEQKSAVADSVRKGIDEALEEEVSGDMAKARKLLVAGPIDISGANLAIFVSRELADGAILFDGHHGRDSMKLKRVCEAGQETLNVALPLSKDAPNREKEIRELQNRFNTILKGE
jgi:hypothetical protein